MHDLAKERSRYVSPAQAALLTGGLLGARSIREMATAGLIPGAVRAGHRFWIPRRAVGDLVQDLSAPQTPVETTNGVGWHSRRAHTLMDGPLAG